MVIRIDSATRIRTITFMNKPKATFYPLEKFPVSKSKLNDFKWYSGVRPIKSMFDN